MLNSPSRTVFVDGIPAKGEYRKFKMRTPGNDDFAHMQEVITRRLSGQNLEKWSKPDLLVIDGGKGQLGAALSVLEQKRIAVPAIGLAKREETIIHRIDSKPHIENFKEIKLSENSEVLKLLMRLRDEAHRFAVTYHSLLRSKRQTASMLDEIPGVGPATRKKLIKHFGSLRSAKQATRAQLNDLLGKKTAERIWPYLSSK